LVETITRRVCRPSITEIDDPVAFLKALTDGYLKDNPYRNESPASVPELSQ